MDMLSLFSSTTTTAYSSPFSFSLLAGKAHHLSTSRFSFSLHNSDLPPSSSQYPADLRRPKTLRTTTSAPKPSNSPPPPSPKPPSNPLKNFRLSQNAPSNPHALTTKLRLTRKISPPPAPAPPSPSTPPPPDDVVLSNDEGKDYGEVEFRQEGKIFVGNLPVWVKKPEVAEFFRQFGPIKNVILIKGHDDLERNLGYGFVIYGGLTAEKSAMKAVEFDGVEFHGRVLTVKLDDGRRLKMRAAERERWVKEGRDDREFRSEWHERREGSRREFKKVLESQPENWQAVVRAFERIKKV